MTGFFKFIRQHGVVGLAIGFILGGAISKVVGSLVQDVIQPLIGFLFGSTEGLNSLHFHSVQYGNFIAALIDFVIIAAVVYFIFRSLKLDRFDAPKQ